MEGTCANSSMRSRVLVFTAMLVHAHSEQVATAVNDIPGGPRQRAIYTHGNDNSHQNTQQAAMLQQQCPCCSAARLKKSWRIVVQGKPAWRSASSRQETLDRNSS